jgi:hypothetical protein
MATTARWALEFQSLDELPDGATLGEELAGDVDAALGRALPVADAAARAALVATLDVGDRGLWILQDDTDAIYLWTGALTLGPFSAGGAGGTLGSLGRWAASSAQPIPNNDDQAVLFATDLATTPDIVRSTVGGGSAFTLQRAGRLSGAATVRYATTTAGGVRDVHVIATVGGSPTYLGSSGGAVTGQPATHNIAVHPVDLPDDAVITVECFQGTGAPRNLEPGTGGRWVQLALELR